MMVTLKCACLVCQLRFLRNRLVVLLCYGRVGSPTTPPPQPQSLHGCMGLRCGQRQGTRAYNVCLAGGGGGG